MLISSLILILEVIEYAESSKVKARISSVSRVNDLLISYHLKFRVNEQDISKYLVTNNFYPVDSELDILYYKDEDVVYLRNSFSFVRINYGTILLVLPLWFFFLYALMFPDSITEHLNGDTPL